MQLSFNRVRTPISGAASARRQVAHETYISKYFFQHSTLGSSTRHVIRSRASPWHLLPGCLSLYSRRRPGSLYTSSGNHPTARGPGGRHLGLSLSSYAPSTCSDTLRAAGPVRYICHDTWLQRPLSTNTYFFYYPIVCRPVHQHARSQRSRLGSGGQLSWPGSRSFLPIISSFLLRTNSKRKKMSRGKAGENTRHTGTKKTHPPPKKNLP